jgi:hypothetical protein
LLEGQVRRPRAAQDASNEFAGSRQARCDWAYDIMPSSRTEMATYWFTAASPFISSPSLHTTLTRASGGAKRTHPSRGKPEEPPLP